MGIEEYHHNVSGVESEVQSQERELPHNCEALPCKGKFECSNQSEVPMERPVRVMGQVKEDGD